MYHLEEQSMIREIEEPYIFYTWENILSEILQLFHEIFYFFGTIAVYFTSHDSNLCRAQFSVYCHLKLCFRADWKEIIKLL